MARKKTTRSTRKTPTGKRGRPTGPADSRITVSILNDACPKCGSTNRTTYRNRLEQKIQGILQNGHQFTSIVRRLTSCADCGQTRIVKTFEFDPESQKGSDD